MAPPRAATVVRPHEGELVDVVGDRYRFLATRDTTDGKYGIWEATVLPGGGPPPHRHSREEEGFYVIDGTVALYADGEKFTAGPGSFVNMPVGSTHYFRNESARPAKLLILVAPGGMEAMFKLVGAPVTDPAAPVAAPGDADKRRLAEIAPAFGIELAPPA